MPALMKEAAACFPGTLSALSSWVPPWQAPAGQADRPEAQVNDEQSPEEAAVAALLQGSPVVLEAMAALLG